MQLIERLNAVIAEFDLLKHTFYQLWSKGELSKDVLRDYSMQYYHQVKSFPCFLSATHSECDDISVRKMLLANLVDEELHGKDHPALWLQFAEGMGANEKETKETQALPETQAMVDTYYDLARRDWRAGLCALYAYESQVPAVSESKIAGLKEFYGINDENTLEFFTAHMEYDVAHAKQVADLIEAHVEPEFAEVATREAAKALWGFLDGMCRHANITCEVMN